MTMRDGAVDAVRDHAIILDEARGVGQILDLIGDEGVALIGEASHGTHEFYRTRAHLTQALVASRQFNVVALEADWPRRAPRRPLGSRQWPGRRC